MRSCQVFSNQFSVIVIALVTVTPSFQFSLFWKNYFTATLVQRIQAVGPKFHEDPIVPCILASLLHLSISLGEPWCFMYKIHAFLAPACSNSIWHVPLAATHSCFALGYFSMSFCTYVCCQPLLALHTGYAPCHRSCPFDALCCSRDCAIACRLHSLLPISPSAS